MAVLTPGKEVTVSAEASETSVGTYLKSHVFLALLAAAGWVALFWPTLCGLAQYWLEDPDYSHGFLIPAISVAITFKRRAELARLPVKGSSKGLVALLLSFVLLALGVFSYTNLLERIAAWSALLSAIWFLLGFKLLWKNRFALLYLVLAIPLPFLLLGSLRMSLKAIATRMSADILSLGGYEAFAEGSVLALGEHQLEVADACSGIRSLMAIISTAILFAYLLDWGIGRGALLTLTAIPVTVAVNVLRILLISIALVSFDVDLTHGAEHEAVGYAVFGVSLALLYASSRFYTWLFRWGPKEDSE